MWITNGRFHVKGPIKKVNVEKLIFFDEIWKIIRQIDDFGRFLNNFCNFGVFLAQNEKHPKMTVLKQWKLKKYNYFFFLNFHFFKTVIFDIFSFWAKNTPILQKLLKKRPKSSNCLIIFHISSKKKSFFRHLPFSWTFDMKSPKCYQHRQQPWRKISWTGVNLLL